MANVFDYIMWRGDLSLRRDPFNEADGLVLSALSYLPFELAWNIINSSGTVSELCSVLLDIPEIEKKVLFKNDIQLMSCLKDSKRYSKITFIDYENHIDTASQTQFCAITLCLANGYYAIVFRGTDNTIIGWKEDFNMSFICPVPAQSYAKEYTDRIIKKYSGRYILCGHSKGGNLATYAAAFCTGEASGSIGKIYSYDSPGFDEKILSLPQYKKICPRLKSYVPQSSIVGMMLEREDNYKVVKSSQIGPFQHDLYSWNILNNKFVYTDGTTRGSKFTDRTLSGWLKEMDYEKRKKFIDVVFSIIEETGALTLNELGGNFLKNAKIITHSIRNLDTDTKKAVIAMLKLLAQEAKKNALSSDGVLKRKKKE